MSKYHINNKGVPSICRAEKGNCPFGDEGSHFATKDAAQEFVNEASEKEHGLLPTLTRKQRVQNAVDRMNELHEELVPSSGMAETSAGELVRATSRIGYRFFNDGDQVGSGYGNETCNSSLRYINQKLSEIKGAEKVNYEFNKLWNGNTLYEDDYEDQLNTCVIEMTNFIDNNPALKNDVNTEDSTADFHEPEDYSYDDDYEEDYEDEDDYYGDGEDFENEDPYGNEWDDDDF